MACPPDPFGVDRRTPEQKERDRTTPRRRRRRRTIEPSCVLCGGSTGGTGYEICIPCFDALPGSDVVDLKTTLYVDG